MAVSSNFLHVPARRDDIEAARVARRCVVREHRPDAAASKIGGSSLGGQALAELYSRSGAVRKPRVTFFDNADLLSRSKPRSKRFDLRTTRFIAISKSGGTAETLSQTLAAAGAIEAGGGGKYLKHHFVAVTEPKPSALRSFAESIGCTVLDHPMGVGGRYAVLTMVGILPALLLGLDVNALRGRGERDLNLLTAKSARRFPPARAQPASPPLARSLKAQKHGLVVLLGQAQDLRALVAPAFGPKALARTARVRRLWRHSDRRPA